MGGRRGDGEQMRDPWWSILGSRASARSPASVIADALELGQLIELSEVQVRSLASVATFAESTIDGVDEIALQASVARGVTREDVLDAARECTEAVHFLRSLQVGDIVIRHARKT
jgi:hypothetical protein